MMHKYLFACVLVLFANINLARADQETLPDPDTIDFTRPEKYNIPVPKISEITGGQLTTVGDVFDYYNKTVQPLSDECSSNQTGFAYRHYGTYTSAPCMQERLEMLAGFSNIRAALTPVESMILTIYAAKNSLDAINDPVQKHISEKQVHDLVVAMIKNVKQSSENDAPQQKPAAEVPAASEVQTQLSNQLPTITPPQSSAPVSEEKDDHVSIIQALKNSDPDGLSEYFYNDSRAMASPSYGCDRNLTPHEKAICNNVRLSIVDDIKVLRYYQVRDVNKDLAQKLAKADHQSELACGSDVDCLSDAIENTTKKYMAVLNMPFYANGGE